MGLAILKVWGLAPSTIREYHVMTANLGGEGGGGGGGHVMTTNLMCALNETVSQVCIT